jgi:hypothetical protein
MLPSPASRWWVMVLPESFMLALQLVIGVGIALLFPLLIYTGVATIKAQSPGRNVGGDQAIQSGANPA